MKQILFLFFGLIFNNFSFTQTYFNQLVDLAGVQGEVYSSLLFDESDNTFLIFGNAGFDHRPYVYKCDNQGLSLDTFLIENNHVGTSYGIGQEGSVLKDYYGDYIITGFINYGGGSSSAYIIKINSNGDTLWTNELGGLGNLDGLTSTQITQDSNYVFGGGSQTLSTGTNNQDFWIVKTDIAGNVLWQNNFGGSSTDYALSVDTTSDGGYILCGSTGSFGAGGNDIYIVKTDANGNFLWHKWYGGNGNDSGYIKSLPNGNYLVYGAYNFINPIMPSENATHAVVMELDANGNQLWEKIYTNYDSASTDYYTYWEWFSSVSVIDDGYVFCGTSIDSEDNNPLGWVVKIDFNGNALWSRRYRKRDNDNYFQDLVELPGGDLVLTGFVFPDGGETQDGWIVRTNCLGFDGPPVSSGFWYNDANNSVILENNSLRFGDGIVYWGDGQNTPFTEFDDTLIPHTYLTSGTYSIQLIVNACNESDTTYINIDATPLSTDKPFTEFEFNLYPNPANQFVILDFDNPVEESTIISIYTLSGQLINELTVVNVSSVELDVSDYPVGTYLVNVVNSKGVLTKKLIVE